jgi:hypothetical protein
MPELSDPTPEHLQRAIEIAREQLGADASVALIDIGLDPAEPTARRKPVVRLHVRTKDAVERLRREGRLPSEIEGVKVVTIVADYRLDDERGID